MKRFWIMETKEGRFYVPAGATPSTFEIKGIAEFDDVIPPPGYVTAPIGWESKASEGDGWQPIETAPKDGSAIWLLSAASEYDFGPEHGGIVKHRPKCAVGSWNPDGDSWVDEHGKLGGDCVTLAVTGTWSSGGGWFQPNEVTHWMPLPKPPEPKP